MFTSRRVGQESPFGLERRIFSLRIKVISLETFQPNQFISEMLVLGPFLKNSTAPGLFSVPALLTQFQAGCHAQHCTLWAYRTL